MRVDDVELNEEYPPKNKCEINSKECQFDLDYICHECGRMACEECAVGVIHQPQQIKYMYENDKKQAHCPSCAESHETRLEIVAGGGVAVLLGLAVAGLLQTPPAIVFGLLILVIGGYLGYREIQLKKNRQMFA